MRDKPSVDIIVPLYNEEKILASSVEKLESFLRTSGFPYPFSITLVNNASTDATAGICDSLAQKYPSLRVLHLKRKGKGYAIREAWSQSTADVLSFMDVDLASDLSFFPVLIEKVASGECDMSMGNRLGKNSHIRGRRLYRELLSRVYNFLIRSLFGSPFVDHQCGFKAMSRDAFRKIAPSLRDAEWFFDTELIVRSTRAHMSLCPIDIVWTDQPDSKVRLFSTSYQLFRSALRLKKNV